MRRTFFKNLIRDIKKSLSRFLSIVIIIAVGVAFYAGVRATSPDMKMSGDYYFNKNKLMDFKLISTLGLTEDDLSEVKKQDGIAEAEGSYSIDAIVERGKQQLVVNVNSLPGEDGINSIRIVRGKRPEAPGEAVVEERFFKDNKLKLGDTIVLKSGSDEDLKDSLEITEFRVVGTAESPLYVSSQRQLSSVGNGIVKGFVYILPEVFKSEVYTEIYVRIDGDRSEDSLVDNETYKGQIERIKSSLKGLGTIRNEIRYAEVLKEAADELDEAQAKLDDSKRKAEKEFADAYKKLKDAQAKITNGKEELKKNESAFNREMENGERQIEEGKRAILAGEQELALRKQELEEAKKLLGADHPQIIAGEAELNKGIAELEARKKQIAEAEEALKKGREEGIKKLQEGKKELEDGQREIDKNLKKLKSEETKAKAEIADAQEEIDEGREKIKEIKYPEWYVFGRSESIGYESYRQFSDRIDNIGKAFPLIFFLVAALVSLTTMTRMVQEKRIEIGTFKALGYSRTAIVSHYLIYSLSASAIGSIIGIFAGFRLLPPFIMSAITTLYVIPDSVMPFNTELALQASLLAVIFTASAAVMATLDELREVPATLMRPKPPKSGKTQLLERVGFIWRRLSFTGKVTARNIFRYKQRLLMTVIGIAACTGLMVAGFGLKEGFIGSAVEQFTNIYRYDLQGTLDKNVVEAEKDEIKVKAEDNENLKSMLFTYSKNAAVSLETSGNQDVYVVVPEDKSSLGDYINLTMKGDELTLDDSGVILTQKISKVTGKKPGDTIEIILNDKVYRARVAAVTEHYVQHYIYMSPAYYGELTGEDISYNSFYGLLKSSTQEDKDRISENLKTIDEVNSIGFKDNAYDDYNKNINTLNTVILVLIAAAGILGFVVIYNLTNINITERRRELATIKVLGFYNIELASYIYRENIILTVLGSLMGIPMGIFLNKLIVATAETSDMMFLQKISPIYFLISILMTMLFSIIVNLAMYNRFDRIDMIESLKSAE